MITISVIILIACAWKFKDYNKLNHRILTDIQKQNEEIRLYLQSLKRNSLDPDAVDGHSLIYNDSDLEGEIDILAVDYLLRISKFVF